MENKKSSFLAQWGAMLTFLIIITIGALVTWGVAGVKYEWIEGQEIIVREGSAIKGILMMAGTLVIAFLLAKTVSNRVI